MVQEKSERNIQPLLSFRNYSGFLIAVLFLFVFSVGTAWSYVYDDFLTSKPVSRETEKTFSSAVVESCTPLLNTLHQTPSPSPTVRTQRAVGKVAALGMMLGARYALEPRPQNDDAGIMNTLDDVGNVLEDHVKSVRKPLPYSARAIAEYRNCLKNQMLAQKI